jgi:DNA-binding response OmpR family regulator
MSTKTQPTILIIEDEQPLLKALTIKLENEHFTVFTAQNGEEGLALALQHHPDIILLDIVMPIMDGVTVLKHLRNDPWGKTAKVIVLSNLSQTIEEDEVIEKGVEEYLVKTNWSLDDVVTKIREAI